MNTGRPFVDLERRLLSEAYNDKNLYCGPVSWPFCGQSLLGSGEGQNSSILVTDMPFILYVYIPYLLRITGIKSV